MAMRADVQYVRYSVDGTAARKMQKNTAEQQGAQTYKRRKAEHKVIAVDPVAIVGIVLSAIVLIAMAIGLVQYQQSLRQSRQMRAYVQQLEQENAQLEKTYQDGYDIEEIRKIALEAGMVPAEQIEQVTVTMRENAQEEAELSFWDTLTTFLAGIFA